MCIIYWQNPKVIWLKTPKAAGTSIRKVLIKRLGQPKKSLSEWEGEFSDESLADYFIFSFVRNPWDRLVSIHRYFGVPIARVLSNHRKLTKSTKFHARPCHIFTHMGSCQFVDFVGKFETLQEDFDKVCDTIGIEYVKLPKLNRTKHSHYSEYYSDDLRCQAAQVYARDIELFGYTFEKNPEVV